MFVCTIAAGQAMAMPDTCKTPAPPAPPVPIPYPNFAMTQMASPASTKVLIGGSPALMKTSEIPLTSGDEPGVAGGVGLGWGRVSPAGFGGEGVVGCKGCGSAFFSGGTCGAGLGCGDGVAFGAGGGGCGLGSGVVLASGGAGGAFGLGVGGGSAGGNGLVTSVTLAN